MMKNKEIIHKFFNKMVGLKITNIKHGNNECIVFIKFGKEFKYKKKKKNKIKIKKRSEWIWVTQSPWRIDLDSMPLVGCSDTKALRNESLKKIKNTTLTNFTALSGGYDLILEFDNSINFYLFSVYTKYPGKNFSWMLLTPQSKVLSHGFNKVVEHEDKKEIIS